MAVIAMAVQPMMKDKMLNNWRAKTNYAAIITRTKDGHAVGDWKELSFAAARRVGGGSKLVYEESGGTDLHVGSNEWVEYFSITRSNTDIYLEEAHASQKIGAEYTYGGVFRINTIEISLS